MEPVTILVLVGAVFAVILSVIFFAYQKRMKESWQGVIVDKQVVMETRGRRNDRVKEEVYYLHVKMSDGVIKKLSLARKLYDGFSVGDAVEKRSGSYNPVKVSA